MFMKIFKFVFRVLFPFLRPFQAPIPVGKLIKEYHTWDVQKPLDHLLDLSLH